VRGRSNDLLTVHSGKVTNHAARESGTPTKGVGEATKGVGDLCDHFSQRSPGKAPHPVLLGHIAAVTAPGRVRFAYPGYAADRYTRRRPQLPGAG